MTTLADFARALCAAGGFPADEGRLDGLVAWSVAEGSSAGWNPLDTTEEAPGATPYNTIVLAGGAEIHVWNYPDEATGIRATLATLNNGEYGAVLAELRTAEAIDPHALARAVGASPWGTGDFSSAVDEVIANREEFYNRPVAATAGSPQPAPSPGGDAEVITPQDVEAIANAVLAKIDPDTHETVLAYLTDFWNNQQAPAINALSAKVDALHAELASALGQLAAQEAAAAPAGVSSTIVDEAGTVHSVQPPVPGAPTLIPGGPVWVPMENLISGNAGPGVNAPPPAGSVGPAGYTWVDEAEHGMPTAGSTTSYQATDGHNYWTYQAAP